MTMQEASRWLKDKLVALYEEREAGNISEWVIENITETRRNDRVLLRNKLLTPEQLSRLDEFTLRLMKREPVQYVLNETWFCGLKFNVDARVLIPRPETEELVEWIISDCKFPIDRLRILDIGTGSGCIPIALKRKLRKPELWSCDISPDALELAKQNAERLGADIHFLQVDILNEDQAAELPSFDMIVSNPPYVPEKEKGLLAPQVAAFEPPIALFAPDEDPLIFYRAIADLGKSHLNQEGSVYVEIPENTGEQIAAVFLARGYLTEVKKDMQGKERMIKATTR